VKKLNSNPVFVTTDQFQLVGQCILLLTKCPTCFGPTCWPSSWSPLRNMQHMFHPLQLSHTTKIQLSTI